MKTITLTQSHRGPNSTIFTGRSQGRQVREELGLSKADKDNESYEVHIPEGTTSFNPSFYLGLFYDSIKNLGGIENFKRKYILIFDDKNPSIVECLKEDISDNERQATNEYNRIK